MAPPVSRSQGLVTFDRNDRSLSSEIAGHFAPKRVVTLPRNNWTLWPDVHRSKLYGELGLVNLLQLIPSMENYSGVGNDSCILGPFGVAPWVVRRAYRSGCCAAPATELEGAPTVASSIRLRPRTDRHVRGRFTGDLARQRLEGSRRLLKREVVRVQPLERKTT